MNLLDTPLPPALAVLGWALLLPALAASLYAVRRGFLPDAAQQHAFLAGMVCVALLWTLQVRVGQGAGHGADHGAGLGMLGAALYVLLFGAARGMLGLLLALALHHALAGGHASGLGLAGLLFAVLPAVTTGGLQRALANLLPKNLFVFIIGNGLFVTLTATALTSVALLLVSQALQAGPAAAGVADRLGYALLLAWGEALASGMLFSALVIFTPGLVRTYREDLYLPPRGARR